MTTAHLHTMNATVSQPLTVTVSGEQVVFWACQRLRRKAGWKNTYFADTNKGMLMENVDSTRGSDYTRTIRPLTEQDIATHHALGMITSTLN